MRNRGSYFPFWNKMVPDNPYMFPSTRTGEMYYPDSIVTLHKRILKTAGLSYINFYSLRHTFATAALQNDVDVKTVSSSNTDIFRKISTLESVLKPVKCRIFVPKTRAFKEKTARKACRLSRIFDAESTVLGQNRRRFRVLKQTLR